MWWIKSRFAGVTVRRLHNIWAPKTFCTSYKKEELLELLISRSPQTDTHQTSLLLDMSQGAAPLSLCGFNWAIQLHMCLHWMSDNSRDCKTSNENRLQYYTLPLCYYWGSEITVKLNCFSFCRGPRRPLGAPWRSLDSTLATNELGFITLSWQRTNLRYCVRQK